MADAVDTGVDEAKMAAGILVGQGHEPGPDRGSGAGTATSSNAVPSAAGADDHSHPGVGRGIGGHVGHASVGGDPGDIILVGGPENTRLRPPPEAWNWLPGSPKGKPHALSLM